MACFYYALKGGENKIGSKKEKILGNEDVC